MKDRGSHQEPTYHDHEEVAFPLWTPHQGYDPRGTYRKIKVLGTGGLIMSRPAHLSLLLGEWHCDSSGYQASTMASVLTLHNTFLGIHKGLWFQG